MNEYRITFIISTDADPSGILDAAVACLPDLIDTVNADGHTDLTAGSECDVSVEDGSRRRAALAAISALLDRSVLAQAEVRRHTRNL